MPMDRSRYPDDWDDISLRIRERDGWRCTCCGVANGALIVRSSIDAARYVIYEPSVKMWRKPASGKLYLPTVPGEFDYKRKPVRIVLTVAHLDHDSMNNADENLAALCQLHHLRHDKHQHATNAQLTRARNRRKRQVEAGQMEMWG